MSLIQLDRSPRVSKNYSFNLWVDYFELKCLINKDQELSLDDMLSEDKQDNVLQDDMLKEKIDGDEFNSERAELNGLDFKEVFKYIESRQNFLRDFYPFDIINKTTLSILPLDDKKYLYIYLLLSSNTTYINKSISSLFTSQFERFSLLLIKIIYPNFKNELFGTAAQKGDFFHGGTLLEKLTILSHCLGTSLTTIAKENSRNLNGAGDKGLDIVSFYEMDRELQDVPNVPFCFGQCTCSYDKWKIKQNTIKYPDWNRVLLGLPSYHEYMFVPFSLRGVNGNWSKTELEGMTTIVIDRIRIINLLRSSDLDFSVLLTTDIRSFISSLYVE